MDEKTQKYFQKAVMAASVQIEVIKHDGAGANDA